jgi:hypothetical protein
MSIMPEWWPIVHVACSFMGYQAGKCKKAGLEGIIYGILFGPLGLIAVLGIDRRDRCPFCYTRLNGPAVICPGCGKGISKKTAITEEN